MCAQDGWVVVVLMLCGAPAWPQPPDLEQTLARIRDEGFSRSRVRDYAAQLIDGIGSRLAGSPNMQRALAWAQQTLRDAGIANVRAETWGRFGLGWQERNTWARMTEPDTTPILLRAAPWSPSTKGAVTAAVVKVRGFRNASEFAAYRGKLRGKIVLYGFAPSPPEVLPIDKPLFTRLTQQDLDAWAAQHWEKPTGSGAPPSLEAHFDLLERAGKFFAAEGAVAVLVPSGNDSRGGRSGGTIAVDTNNTFGWFVYQRDRAMTVPLAVTAIEHYGRIERLLARGVPVRLELQIDTVTAPRDVDDANVFADIPGTDPTLRHELVFAAAHLDSWSSGTGATDDGAGVIIAMEAMRILQAAGARPRRTIRLALWGAEEQGALGSRAWAKRYLGHVPLADSPLPDFLRPSVGPPQPVADPARISAVYTLDAGGGRIRGVSTGNPALVPLFREWFRPLADLGATMVAPRSDCGGDCLTFQQLGVPTPSFKQDPLAYGTRTHHTNMDTFEHLIEDDLKQAAVIVAQMLYRTAMLDGMLPHLEP